MHEIGLRSGPLRVDNPTAMAHCTQNGDLGVRAGAPISLRWWGCLLILGVLSVCGGGCFSPRLPTPSVIDSAPYSAETIQIGDFISVTFPGATNLNFSQQVRVDGSLHLDQSRELPVLDKTPKELKTNLLEVFGGELVRKELNLVVEPAGFSVFVSGAVAKPGKVNVNRSVTVLEAIMEAGGYDPNRANLRRVQVIRQEKNAQKTFVLDVGRILKNPLTIPFHLRPSDVVIVPERFVFF